MPNFHTQKKLYKLCGIMIQATRAFQVLLVVIFMVLLWLAITNNAGYADFLKMSNDLEKVTLTPITTVLLLVLLGCFFGLIITGLKTVTDLFEKLRSATPLSFETAILLRRTGIFALSVWVAEQIYGGLCAPLATAGNPPTERIFQIGFGINDALLLLMAGFLFTMGHVMVLASRVNDEYARII
ncbi:hypothetical protein EDC90_100918 [Martelella mediterranea]|uniref:DUF2975 family protein n=2 Tax=Martelella mediterranea TaxID=293089 RepID=A0A4R3NTD1_9HYPH|nr:hypothetical protein EDC90_100918 [Martelella mediterranea]